jgi:hypothetical protein
MLSNPLIQRYRFSAFRPQKLQVFIIMYAILLALVVFINCTLWSRKLAYDSGADCFQGIFLQLSLFQVFLWWGVGGYLASTAFKEELLAKTHDFFRLLPLSPLQKMTGVLVGKNLLPLVFGVCNLVFLFFFGCRGGLPLSLQAQVVFFILSMAVFLLLLGFLFSMKPNIQKGNPSLLLLILVVIFVVPSLLGGLIGGFHELTRKSYEVEFFTLRIPILVFLSLQAWYWGIWAGLGILRRFKREYEPLMTLKSGVLFYIGYEIILVGLMVPQWEKSQAFLYTFWLLSLVPAIFIPTGMIREFNQYLEYLGSIGAKANSSHSGWFMLAGHSFLPKGLVLFGLWGLIAIGGIRWTATNFQNNLYALGVLFSFYIVYLLFLELYVVYKTTSSKAGLFLGFLWVLYLIMPPILAGLFENETLISYSPLGFLLMYPLKTSHYLWYGETGIWIQNVILSLIAITLILRRYRNMLEIRRKLLLPA